jgi:dolichyl-diphosphooligosaccharide--protein glycosyltransferase
MGDNLPEDAIVASWWDFGYWIEAFSNRTTLADGATIRTSHIGKIGRIFMLNYTESMEIIESLDVTHVLTYATLNPNNPDEEWPYGLNVKWSWMVQIGGLNMSNYINPDTYSNKLGQTEVGRQSVFYRLMMNTPDPPFIPVYVSDFGFVRVFEVDYDYEVGQT